LNLHVEYPTVSKNTIENLDLILEEEEEEKEEEEEEISDSLLQASNE
jgi:hypothetical protein